jgi:hypothetical protein
VHLVAGESEACIQRGLPGEENRVVCVIGNRVELAFGAAAAAGRDIDYAGVRVDLGFVIGYRQGDGVGADLGVDVGGEIILTFHFG